MNRANFSGFKSAEEIKAERDEWLENSRIRNEEEAVRYNATTGDLNKEDCDCDICKNKGFVMKAYYVENMNNYYTALYKCSCMKVREAKHLARVSGLNDLLDNKIEKFDDGSQFRFSLKNKVLSYLESDMTKWVVFLGQSGAGKTLCCSIIANAFLAKNIATFYIVWGIWIKELKRNQLDDDFDDFFTKYQNVPVLYIDDFLKGKFTDTDLSYAFDLINTRYNRKLITIISSERLLDELIDIDEALAGRLKQMAGDYLIQIGKSPEKNYRFYVKQEVL